MAVGISTRIAYPAHTSLIGIKEAAAQSLSAVGKFETVSYSSLEDVIVAVKQNNAKFAVVPVESTTHGSYYDTYDLLLKYDVAVVGEAKPSDKSARFWLVAKTPTEPSLKMTVCKTSLVFAFASGNAHGQLYRALGLFASHDIDLSKVESRLWSSTHPSAGKAEFIFYVDMKARQSDAVVVEAITSLRATCLYVRVLGCYASDNVMVTKSEVQMYPLNPVFDTTTVAKTITIFGKTKQLEAEGKFTLCW